MRPFCTCSSIGNQVDGLPIVLSFRSKNDEVENTCEVKCPVNLYFSESPYHNASMWAMQWSKYSGKRRVLFKVDCQKMTIFEGQKNDIFRRSGNESMYSQTCQAAFYKKFLMK